MTYRLDEQLAAALPGLPPVDLADIADARATAAGSPAARGRLPQDPLVTVTDLAVPGLPGRPEVALRLFVPAGPAAEPLPAVYDIHGGGFVLGSLDAIHARDVRLCRETGAVVVAVDYRLAPEHRYPAALDDCHAGLRWLAGAAADLGVDGSRIAVYGQSAGASLAAALTHVVRDGGGPALCFQYLGTPALDDRLATRSMRDFTDTPGWWRANAVRSWESYLGAGVPGSDGVPPYAAPARAADFAGLPPAYITAMEFDPLRDEGIAYAQALLAAGVPVELHVFPGTFHGSVGIRDAEVSRREAAEEVAVLRRALYGPGAGGS